ncbi:glycosyltransferase family 4 protein [Paenibacillus cremeus]|uniref:Glycosyltransferase family 4 protein n=1 Tax=Paenibacillus cremeus TaxID=2163881 RepID=A0A559K4Z9_9BACL|nr:glycosyltransferase family 4 protein [Paenibacillus cremeus]TVY07218.1 glycosyltransferase family 4 protein [Paenibacillus cremeus]
MKRRMRILIISDEVWNDEIHGNNILTNWFQGFDAEFANIYCSPGSPLNPCCNQYFQITDSMMLKSIFGKKKAGKSFKLNSLADKAIFDGESENKRLYSRLKFITTESLRAVRELIWFYGKYDFQALQKFIDEFKPDIIFSPRLATIKMLRLEKIVCNIAQVPIVAFTGDAEYSMRIFRISPIFWVKKLILRNMFRKMMLSYSLYYTLSDEQREEYQNEFGEKFKILRKCGEFKDTTVISKVKKPIKIIYAGKIYSNRWKTLVAIRKALKVINEAETKILLEIYTRDKMSNRQRELLDDGKNSFVKGAVSPEELKTIYNNSDIALHVESFDLRNRLLTKVSFSTKIIDCLGSGCAVMVISWDKHSGFTYLKKENAAFTISNLNDISIELKKIVENPNLINIYAQNALKCGQRNHKKDNVQQMIYEDFIKIIRTEKTNEEGLYTLDEF